MRKYELMIGLLDKDSKMQEISSINAYKIVQNIIIKKIGYCTITDSVGIYTHENGEIVTEKSLIVTIIHSTDIKDKISEISKLIKSALNQESILLIESDITTNNI